MRCPKELTIKELRNALHNCELTSAQIEELNCDPRKGVRRLLERYAARKEEEQKEEKRLQRLYRLENLLVKKGFPRIAGADEAGRGPLAGPVVAAAVVLPKYDVSLGLKDLNDSKKLSDALRRKIFQELRKKAWISWSAAEVEEIEELNIQQASLKAMGRAVASLNVSVDYLLVDGKKVTLEKIPQRAVKRGDTKSASIAAASVVAKVVRDQKMEELNEIYPYYGFAEHKGYPTAGHRKALQVYGPSPIHRPSFVKKYK